MEKEALERNRLDNERMARERYGQVSLIIVREHWMLLCPSMSTLIRA